MMEPYHLYLIRIIDSGTSIVTCVDYVATSKKEAALGAYRMALGPNANPEQYAFEVKEVAEVEGREGQYQRFGVRRVLDVDEQPELEVVG